MIQKLLAIDLFAGLGGWADGLLAEGYDVIGFDIERHDYGEHRYPGTLVIQDVCTLHGRQFKDAALIVASPPCQEYSYMAMPWKLAKAKAKAKAIRNDTTGAKLAALNRTGALEADGQKVPGFRFDGSGRTDPGNGVRFTSRDCGIEKIAVAEGRKGAGAGAEWFDQNLCALSSKSLSRKAASAMIAKIPITLSRHIGATFASQPITERVS